MRTSAFRVPICAGLTILAAGLFTQTALPEAAERPLQQAEAQISELTRAAAQSQERIDAAYEETRTLAQEYRTDRAETDSLREHSARLETLIAAQKTELEDLALRAAKIEAAKRGLLPLIADMVDSLKRSVELDIPFLIEERRQRVHKLAAALPRSDLTVAEKYRRVLEAYQIEAEYGHSIAAYRGPLPDSTEKLTVDFLRVGRLALYYRSLDGRLLGSYDRQQRSWIPLPPHYEPAVRAAVEMTSAGRQQELLSLPICSPGGCDAE